MQNKENIDTNIKCKNKYGGNNENILGDNTRYCTPKRKSIILSTIKSASNSIGLSPISEIACELHDRVVFTPTIKLKNCNALDCYNENKESDVPFCKDSQEQTTKDEEAKDESTRENENSLISNNFTINSGGRDQRRIESQVLSVHRRQNAEPFALRYDDTDVEDEDIDDENGFNGESVLQKSDDLSFYGNQSPRNSPRPRPRPLSPLSDCRLLSPECSPKRFKVTSTMVTMIDRRKPVDEIDGGSCSNSSNNSSSYDAFPFKFAQPQLMSQSQSQKLEPSPRKLHPSSDIKMQSRTLPDLMTMNQRQQSFRQNEQNTSPPKSFRVFHSLSSTESMESMDDDYMDFFEMESLEDDTQFPSDLKSLISGHIKSVKTNTTPEVKRPLIRRCLSMQDNVMNRVRGALFEPKTPEIFKSIQTSSTTPLSQQQNERCFKRPEPPTPTMSPLQNKRCKMETSNDKENDIFANRLQENQTTTSMMSVSGRCLLRKSISMNDAQIMTALARSSSEPDLIGDFSKPFCLPLTEGRHRDLKSISSETMAKLIRGEFKESVSSFKIIDCRYPYEYDGGHIRGAHNLYTHEQILEELVNCKTESPTVQSDGPKRQILVFHCEFSSERGPKLSRFLRNHDRSRNSLKYPALHYPEIYLLHGGYKEFFERYSDLCEPVAYRPMLDPSFGAAYKQFRAKSKSWNGGDTTKLASGIVNRTKKSRSRLVL